MPPRPSATTQLHLSAGKTTPKPGRNCKNPTLGREKCLKPGRRCKKPTLGRENTPKTRPTLQKTFTRPGKHPQNPAITAKNFHSAGKTGLKPGRLCKNPTPGRENRPKTRPALRKTTCRTTTNHFRQPSCPALCASASAALPPRRFAPSIYAAIPA